MCGMVAYPAVTGRAGAALALAVGVAQGAARALRPRDGLIARRPVRVEDHFSAEEPARARAFRRPQLVLGFASAGMELGLLAALAARPPRALGAVRPALAGTAISLAGTLAPLPLRAVARRRAVCVGLVTQSWPGWGGDLAKSGALGAGFAAAGAELAAATPRRPPPTPGLPR